MSAAQLIVNAFHNRGVNISMKEAIEFVNDEIDPQGNLSRDAVKKAMQRAFYEAGLSYEVEIKTDWWQKSLTPEKLAEVFNDAPPDTDVYVIGRANLPGIAPTHFIPVQGVNEDNSVDYVGTSKNDDLHATRVPRTYSLTQANATEYIYKVNYVSVFYVRGKYQPITNPYE